ncbi:MAG: PEP-CTERM sorting domain-containing protein [Pirellulales bacterium]
MRSLQVAALAALIAATCTLNRVEAAFIVEADNVAPAGKAFDHFSSLGHSLSSGFSTAAGLIGNQSAFGNPANATGPDLYTLRYTPGPDVDNTVFATGALLGNSSATDGDGAGAGLPVYTTANQLATGLAGGGTGIYNVYFTTPSSTNVNPAGSLITVNNDGAPVELSPVVLNDGGTGPDEVAGVPYTGGANNRWLNIATVHLTAGTTYTVTVRANADPPDFVSQRTHGVMWEFVAIPEPSSFVLAALGLFGVFAARRRSA